MKLILKFIENFQIIHIYTEFIYLLGKISIYIEKKIIPLIQKLQIF